MGGGERERKREGVWGRGEERRYLERERKDQEKKTRVKIKRKRVKRKLEGGKR